MLALTLTGSRELVRAERPNPPLPGPGEVQLRIGAVALNHIDVWSWRGMAFAKRQLPMVIGAEGAGTVTAIGEGVSGIAVGDVAAVYGAQTCGICPACRSGRENLCENPGGVRGFHIDGLLQDYVNLPARQAIGAPKGVSVRDAACAPITYGTVEHMLFDNARLEGGQTILVHAGGSGIGTAAIQLAKAVGATVITTVGSDDKAEKAKALGADHVINYRENRFEGVVRKLTQKRGVDVVFEHVGPDTFAGSLFSLKKGGVLVTCGSTTGVSTEVNLYQIFQQQLRIIGSFGCSRRNVADSLVKMGKNIARPVIDTEIRIEDIGRAFERMESRNVFGKIIVTL
jgi:alcohol dehydrogenase